MSPILYIAIGLFVGVVIYLLFLKGKEKPVVQNDQTNTGFQLLQSQLHDLARLVENKLTDSERALNETMRHQSNSSNTIIRDITERLTRLDETNKQVISFTDQLQGLQDMLKNPKQRGILGEYYLETLLKNVMPPGSYQMQYPFSDGTIVDAAVFVKDKIIPIDSKFSLENYNRITEASDPAEKERFEKIFRNLP